ncbi:MAG: alpha/beta hydrolase [Candidatus Thiodiazotropha endolucinida]
MKIRLLKDLAVVVISGCLLTACTTLRHSERVELEGSAVGYASVGEGDVTIVLESGLGDGMTSWDGIMDELAQISRVFAYSRPGYFPSRASNRSRNPDQVVDELRLLLKQTGHTPPYLLVGHSLGGLYVLNFVERYPGEVAGVVLVDGRHPMMTQACLKRALNGCSMPSLVQSLLPRHAVDEYKAAQTSRLPVTMGDKPLAVISRAPGHGMNSAGWDKLWSEMQVDLAELSSRSIHLVARRGGHYVHKDEPDRVIEGINWVLSKVRSDTRIGNDMKGRKGNRGHARLTPVRSIR